MKISEILSEHSNYPVDPTVTPTDILNCKKAMLAVSDVAKTRGFSLVLTNHFFDQIKLKRGFGKITAEMIIRTFGKIFNRGMHLIEKKAEGTTLVFHDLENGLYVPFRKLDNDRYMLPTVVRDTRWLAPGDVVDL
jgi:hypothetical protein